MPSWKGRPCRLVLACSQLQNSLIIICRSGPGASAGRGCGPAAGAPGAATGEISVTTRSGLFRAAARVLFHVLACLAGAITASLIRGAAHAFKPESYVRSTEMLDGSTSDPGLREYILAGQRLFWRPQ